MSDISWIEGVHYGWTFDQYKSIPALNISTLKWAGVSAAHLKAALDGLLVRSDSRDMAFGRALHAILLEPDTFASEFVIAGKCQSAISSGKRKGQPCGANAVALYKGEWLCGRHVSGVAAEWFKESHGTVLTEDEARRIKDAASCVSRHPVVRLLRQRGGCEATVCFEREGVRCKGRIDKDVLGTDSLPPVILDLKKVQVGGATMEAIEQSIYRYQYDAQAAWYVDAVYQLRGEMPQFVWVFVEHDYPFRVRPVQCNPQTLAVGRMRYSEYLGVYLQCKSTNEWPGYSDTTKIEQGGLPAYVLNRYLGR